MIEKKNYPISVLEDIAFLLKSFYSLEYKYSDILDMKFNETHLVEIRDIEKSPFRFIVSTPQQGADKKTVFNVSTIPKNNISNDELSIVLDANITLIRFKSWVSIILRYETITLTKEEYYSKAEEKEFYEEFEINEEDSDIKVLSIENQIKVYQLLEDLQHRLEQRSETNPKIKEIIEDAEVLKNNIQNLPQSEVAKRVAKLKVKIKKIGIKFFMDFIDVAYKEAIKFALRGGVDGIQHLLS
ncbi:MAG TPA: hypothetical protein VGP55_13645 [Chitinophagaceae bacterium]|nr:hypothetical protein [Chitinophagaceae bacterium]